MSEHPICPGYVMWEIIYGGSSDDYTHVCSDHLNRMLSQIVYGENQHTITPTVGPPNVSADKRAELKCCFIDKNEETAALFQRMNKLENENDQLRVQLAGCSVAASGGVKGPQDCRHGAYGWSVSLEDVKRLYLQYDQARKALEAISALPEEDPRLIPLVHNGLRPLPEA